MAQAYKSDIIIASCCAALSAGLGVVFYLFAYRLILASTDEVMQELLLPTAGILLIVFAFRYLLLAISSRFAHQAAFNTLHGLRMRLVEHVATLPMGFFSRTDSGTLNKIIGEDVERVEGLLAHHIPDVVSSLVLPVVLFGVLAWHDVTLALCSLGPLLLAMLAQRKLFRLRDKNIRHFHATLERVNAIIVEFIRCIPLLKSLNRDVYSHVKYTQAIHDYVDVTSEWSIRASRYYALFKVALGSGLIFLVPPGAYLIVTGSISPQTLTLFLLLGLAFTAPLDKLILFAGSLNQIMESVRRIDSVLEQSPLPALQPSAFPERYDISFENVSFSFAERTVFSQRSFFLRQGTLNAFIGHSGAGKSTALQLIARFYDPSDGKICIGGHDIRHIEPARLNTLISVVFQNSFLFSDSIENNIRAGLGEQDFAQVQKAAEAAYAHDFIMSLPEGYQTIVGTGGQHLSGGERQRIAIARAVLKNAPILLLDEATAFADPENELAIQRALAQLAKNKTVVIVAHRLTTVVDADQILLFSDGGISASGKHADLLASSKEYAELWERQNAATAWEIRGSANA